jgi:hypothetical protein
VSAVSTVLASSSVVAPEGRGPDDDPSLLLYYRDLVEPFGATVDPELLRSGPRVFHRDLIEHMVTESVRRTAPDLVILTHALPDVTPFTAAAAHLTMLLGGGAITFGISQQGLAAPFTALRVAECFRRSRRCSRALVAVLEQTTLPTRHRLVEQTPLVDSGALVVLGDGDGPALKGVEVLKPHASPAAHLRTLADTDPVGTLFVLGPWVDRSRLDTAATHHDVTAGSYATSVWVDLARHWDRWREEFHTVVLCDTDPLLHRSCVAVLGGATSD